MFGVAFPKILLIQPVVPLFEGVEGTVAHPMGCPTVPRGSFRHEHKKKAWVLLGGEFGTFLTEVDTSSGEIRDNGGNPNHIQTMM